MVWIGAAHCKTVGSAYVGSNPTPATTCENGPLAAETRPGGPFSSCHAVYQRVSLRVDARQWLRTYSGQRPGRNERCATPLPFTIWRSGVRGRLAAVAGRSPVADTFAGRGGVGGDGGPAQRSGEAPVAFLGLRPPGPAAGLVISGLRPAQEDRWAPDGNRVLSSLVSAMASWAARRAQPGMDSACCSCCCSSLR